MAFPLINARFILLISASFIAIFSSIAIYFCLPILISHVIRTQITLSQNSGSFDQWRMNSVIDRVYLYNITNLNELMPSDDSSTISTTVATFASDQRKLKIKEVGPFTYRQDREKLNINFDKQNETVLYDQKKTWLFLPGMSASNSTSINTLWINHINIPLAGTTANPEYAEFVEPVIAENDLRLFLNHSVGTLMFEGYPDILMEQAKASGQIDVDRFGWMHNQNNTITKSIRVFTGTSNVTLDKFGAVDEFNQKREFQIWHNNNTKPGDFRNVKCNQFRLSSTGEFFPPPDYSFISHSHLNKLYSGISLTDLTPTWNDNYLTRETSSRTKSISLFMPDICRTFQLFYNGSREHKGLSVDRYIANEYTFDYLTSPNKQASNDFIESNKCYCVYNETTQALACPPNGMMELFHCKPGSPVTISFPHFLYSTDDATLKPYTDLFNLEKSTTGNQDDYQFFIDLEPTLNLPVNVQIVLQFNVRLRNEMNFTKEYSFLFKDNQGQSMADFYLPQMWIQSTGGIDDANLNNLIFIQRHLRLVTPIATILLFGCASILLLAAAKLAYDLTYGSNMRKPLSCDEESTTDRSNHLCSAYEQEKKKFLSMQLLKSENHGATMDFDLKSKSLMSSNKLLGSSSLVEQSGNAFGSNGSSCSNESSNRGRVERGCDEDEE